MVESNFLTIATVLGIAAALAYRLSFLQRRKLWHFSLEQIVLLVVLPGILFPLLFSYLQSIITLPQNPNSFLPDRFLVNMVLLSALFTYGGISIHAVTKMFNYHKPAMGKELSEIHKFFHLTFSHNLGFASAIISILGITLLELNHVTENTSTSIWGGIARGLLLGGAMALSTYNYTRYTIGDKPAWNDLKFFFAVVWVGFVLLLYGVQKVDPRVTEYQMLLPALLGFSLMALLSFLLVLRRVKRRWSFYFRRSGITEPLGVED